MQLFILRLSLDRVNAMFDLMAFAPSSLVDSHRKEFERQMTAEVQAENQRQKVQAEELNALREKAAEADQLREQCKQWALTVAMLEEKLEDALPVSAGPIELHRD